MSEYVIHNIDLVVTPQLDFDKLVEQDKPMTSFPHYYISKLIGGKGNVLSLNRPGRSKGQVMLTTVANLPVPPTSF